MQKTIATFTNSAGALLLAMTTALFLINFTSPADSILPHDPIFLTPFNHCFWIIGGITAVVALACFFSDRSFLPACLLLWLSVNYLVFRIGLFCDDCHSLTGYLGGFPYTFGISAQVAGITADILFVYLLIGSCVTLRLERRLPAPIKFQKMFCPACGGHVKFSIGILGQKLGCPHCTVMVTLRKPEELLKMDCFFCKEHIEFPAHALGRKIRCPHCKMEIGLREKTV